ncbi:MAG: NAD-dependent epimerase/dehydratase family protein, partial [Ilumatobacteraceae bacterium]
MTSSLVTGGTGYFGSLLVRRLVTAGHRVRVLDLNSAVDLGDDVELMIGDIRDADVVARAVAGCDIVFNNVAQVPLA